MCACLNVRASAGGFVGSTSAHMTCRLYVFGTVSENRLTRSHSLISSVAKAYLPGRGDTMIT